MHRRCTCRRALEDEPARPLQIADEELGLHAAHDKGPKVGMGVPLLPRSSTDENRDLPPWCIRTEVKAVEPKLNCYIKRLACVVSSTQIEATVKVLP